MSEQLDNKDGSSTIDNILNSAKAEFLEKGFKDASLRNIAKQAGVTTGAIYGYFNTPYPFSQDFTLDTSWTSRYTKPINWSDHWPIGGNINE